MCGDVEDLKESERLKRRFKELGVAYTGGAEQMTDEELNFAAAKLHQWWDERLAEGAPLFPPNVCLKCFRPHQESSLSGSLNQVCQCLNNTLKSKAQYV